MPIRTLVGSVLSMRREGYIKYNVRYVEIKLWRLLKHSTGMVCISSCMSVCLSVCSHDNSRMSRCRTMKLCTNILKVKSNMEFKDESRT